VGKRFPKKCGEIRAFCRTVSDNWLELPAVVEMGWCKIEVHFAARQAICRRLGGRQNVSRRVAEGDITDGMGRRLGLAIALSPAALNSSTTVGGFVSTTIFGHPGPVRRAEESIRQSRVNCC
jgi:hypothetical protein